ncbi:tetratricopeptide repeat protein 1 [Cimex lectularius]|uniref:Tetratricopeptide repeat protein 1 n=1 Tax=Cimex lectularius TaxID=79782 RepID=A0A8I6SAE4_CIMLE|nr:tetratricopeptide repeat protein 1 [Cimex lectularius]
MPTSLEEILKEGDRIPTSEEIAEELTKDLEADCTLAEGAQADEPQDTREPETQGKPKDDDLIDEDELKKKDTKYSEDDRQKYKKEAEALKLKGNDQFKAKEFKEAALTYTLALRTCPYSISKDRSVLYANRAAAKVKLGLTESAIEDCSKALELDDHYLKAYLRRAQLYEESDKLDEALADYKKILEFDPTNKDALEGNFRLPPIINERNEKLKTEMLGKLKDLGNIILKPFGLSTNNFQMVQDPNSGGYSINFKK